MKKLYLVCLVTAGLFLAPMAIAKNDTPGELAIVNAGGCEMTQVAPFGTSLLVRWSWEDGTVQTKFGGDAAYMVVVSGDGGTTFTEPFEVEFELVMYVPGTLADDYFGQLVYRCSNAQTEELGKCNAAVLGLRDAIYAAATEETGFSREEIGANITATRVGVNIKAMNPGKQNGRQNYPLVDVCFIDI